MRIEFRRLGGVALVAPLLAYAQVPSRPLTDSEVKAQYVVSVARCVEWSASKDSGEFRIGVLSDDGLEEALRAYEGKTVMGRRIVIQTARNPRNLQGCPVICLGEAEEVETVKLVRLFRAPGTLTFGESEAFHRAGGVVRFQREGGRIRLAFHRWALQESGLKVNSRLLSITQQVDP